MELRAVGLLVYDNVNLVDVAGLPQVFATASSVARRRGLDDPGYAPARLFSVQGGLVRSTAGISLDTAPLAEAGAQRWDCFLVAGGSGVHAILADQDAHAVLRRIAPTCRRFGSICSGALMLQAAGLLAGRRVTTHWRHCQQLQQSDPGLRVEADALYVEDDALWTSAGVTAGMDMALAMVERDLGRAVALDTARDMVLFLKRPGGQSQFSVQLASQTAQRDGLSAVASWILDQCGRRLTVEEMAARAAMSPRNFARVFLAEFGTTPARFLEKGRLEAARRLLEDSREPLDRIAAACGFGHADRMRRAFMRELQITPSDYRARFAPTPRAEKVC